MTDEQKAARLELRRAYVAGYEARHKLNGGFDWETWSGGLSSAERQAKCLYPITVSRPREVKGEDGWRYRFNSTGGLDEGAPSSSAWITVLDRYATEAVRDLLSRPTEDIQE